MAKKIKKIKSFDDACKILNQDATLPSFTMVSEKEQAAMIAHYKLMIIIRAANTLDNDGAQWTPNWKDSSQYKYYAWFEMDGSSGFRFRVYVGWLANSYVGSRLCFKSYERCTEIAKTFFDLYKDYFVL